MEHFFHLLQDKLRQRDSSLHIDWFQAGEWKAGQDVGETLMNRYAPQADYHPMDSTRAEYIAKRHLLKGRALIAREAHRSTEWVNFAVEYARHGSPQNGLLILTFSGACPVNLARKGMTVLKWGAYVTSYDMQLFASYCVADRPGLSPVVRNYITQLASRMAGTDPVLCGALSTEEAATDAIGLLQRLASHDETAAHLLEDPLLVSSIVWEAQIQIIFPMVERLRRSLIEQYREQLQGVLPQRDDFDKELKSPQDMELRHMWYYYFKSAGFRSKEDERTFRLLYDARNDLAHLDLLDGDTAMRIFALES